MLCPSFTITNSGPTKVCIKTSQVALVQALTPLFPKESLKIEVIRSQGFLILELDMKPIGHSLSRYFGLGGVRQTPTYLLDVTHAKVKIKSSLMSKSPCFQSRIPRLSARLVSRLAIPSPRRIAVLGARSPARPSLPPSPYRGRY